MAASISLIRPPQDDDELHELVWTLFGFRIPRTHVCPDHRPPFEAFANAYFAREPVSVWKASRGLGGKSTLLGILSLTEACVLKAQVTVLGGSAAQSQRVHEVTKEAWEWPLAPHGLMVGDPTMFQTRLAGGAWIRPLMASSRSVRGPHPQRLRLDEVDEMDLDIFEAAQGQPMDGNQGKQAGIEAQTVISSTHQYPDKTMTECLKRARENNWGVYHWCYRENMGPDGWLKQSLVDRKKQEISHRMWDIEFELQEPGFEGRAIDIEFLEKMFDPALGEYEGAPDEWLVFDQYNDHHQYVTGIDWAREKDWTIVTTWDRSELPWRMVAFYRVNKLPWPAIIAKAEKQSNMFRSLLIHDALGIGNVVKDMLTISNHRIVDRTLAGRDRANVFTEYISAVERGDLIAPRVKYMFDEHKYVTMDDLYSTGGHPPDTFISGALSWSLRSIRDRSNVTLPVFEDFARAGSPWTIG